jgi:L-seryl-tRNA(Ser) seleniumtransferase
MAPVARAKGVPILVDAAAEILTIPNVHVQNGATLVAYSGGKCIRGPQSAGLLLGRKDLVRAAVGKEEAIGMLMAVEMWVKRDHDAEWKRWTAALDHIARRVTAVDGVTTTIAQPAGLSNRTPSLRVFWNRQQFGVAGDEIVRTLLETDPRIATAAAGGGGDPARTGVSITPYMMNPGDETIVADRLHAVLTARLKPRATAAAPAAPAADLSGQWDVRIEYAASVSNHALHLRQRNNQIDGSHQGDFVSRDLSGTIEGDAVRLRSSYTEQHGDALSFTFSGKATADQMSGTLDMGEYLTATWTARRHTSSRG